MKHEPKQAIGMEQPLETAWVGLIVVWGGSSGNHQGGENSVSQIVGVSDMAPACQFCGGRSQKRNNGLCQQSCLRESAPPDLTLMLDISVPPRLPLVPLNLLPHCWSSEGVSLSKSMCRLFKRNSLGI